MIGHEISAPPAAHSPRQVALHVGAAEIVHGRTLGRVAVQLVDTNGHALRQLSAGLLGHEEFMLPGTGNGPLLLLLTGMESEEVTIALTTAAISPGPQTPPDSAPQSPRLKSVLAGGESSLAFWKAISISGTPLVECPPGDRKECLVTFLWRGAQRNVHLLGAPGTGHAELQRLGNTDIWFRSFRLPTTARFTYKLAPDVPAIESAAPFAARALIATLQRDPLNPMSFPPKPSDEFAGESVLTLPSAAELCLPLRPAAQRKHMVATRFHSRILGNTRDIYLYRSAGYRITDPHRALVVMFDAEMLSHGLGLSIMETLTHTPGMPPFAAILISNPGWDNRSTELPPNPAFLRFLGEELMPWATHHDISAEAVRTVIAGTSFGGLAAAHAALNLPNQFGNVLSLSGAYWWTPAGTHSFEWLAQHLPPATDRPVRFHLEAGKFEDSADAFSILQSNRHFRDALLENGYPTTLDEIPAAHDWLNWSCRLPQGFTNLLEASRNGSSRTSQKLPADQTMTGTGGM